MKQDKPEYDHQVLSLAESLALRDHILAVEGLDYPARLILTDMQRRGIAKSGRVLRPAVIDGLRTYESFAAIRNAVPLRTVAVHADPIVRYQRVLSRKRPDQPRNPGEMDVLTGWEISRGLGRIIAEADYHLDGTSDPEQMRADFFAIVFGE
jgi:hypothetical protein